MSSQEQEIAKLLKAAQGGVSYEQRSNRHAGIGDGSNITGFNFQKMDLSDPIAQIAQRVGQLQAESMNYRVGNGYFSTSGQNPAQAQMGSLQQLLDSYMEERQMNMRNARRQQRPQMHSAPPRYGNTSINGQGDENSDARREAVQAALKYMSINKPHLISSLGLKK